MSKISQRWQSRYLFGVQKSRFDPFKSQLGFFYSILSAILYVALDAQLIHPLWQDMSSEVVDSNPYSRLMALQRMGIVENYERIREFSVAIVVSINALFFFYFSFI